MEFPISIGEKFLVLMQRYACLFHYLTPLDVVVLKDHFTSIVSLDFHNNTDVFFLAHIILVVSRPFIGANYLLPFDAQAHSVFFDASQFGRKLLSASIFVPNLALPQ